jgi:DNA-directed RNA polymerase specialized sigma24 family protein
VTPILASQRPTPRLMPQRRGKALIAAAFERHAHALVTYIRRDLAAADSRLARDAEDLAGDVWLSITESADPVDGRVLDLNWLRMIARSVVRKHRAARGPEWPAGLTGDERALVVAGFEDDVVDAMLAKPRQPLPRRNVVQLPVIEEPQAVPAAVRAVAA